MAIVKQGSTTLNSGAKGDKGIQGDAGVVQSIAAGANVTVDASDPANPIVSSSGGGGASNLNINPVTSLAELLAVTGVNEIIDVQEPITLLANYQIPSGQQWIFSTGYVDIDTFQLDFNGASLNFNSKIKGLDLSGGTVIGDVTLLNDILYASNIGALDDDTFDNWQSIFNALHIVNQNGATLKFNKQTAIAIYYLEVYDDTHASPFFTNGFSNDNTLVVGNRNYGDSYDGIEVTSESGVKIRTFAGSQLGSSVFSYYNTFGSSIHNNHFIGDRYSHFYDEEIKVIGAATSAGNVRLVIKEYEDFENTNVTKEINELIPLTLSNQATNRQEVIDYINTNAAFSDYTATALAGNDNNITIRTTAGQYTDAFFTDVDSGATVSYSSSYYEWGHCIVQDSRAVKCITDHNTIEQYHGDGIAKQEQGNGTAAITFAHLTQGFIDETGAISASTDYYYSDIRDMPSPHDWFRFGANTATSVKLLHFKYWMVYYDDAGTPAFVEKSPTLTPYDIYKYPTSKFKKYRIVVENSGTDMSEFNYFINSPSIPEGGVISHNKFYENRRHAVTNVIDNQVVEYNEFYRNSGISPQIELNVEDWSKRAGGQIIRHNIFYTSNVACISLKGCTGVQIYGNRFLQGSHQLNSGYDWNIKTLAITVSYARDSKIYNNYFTNRNTYTDIMTQSYNNFYTNSVLAMRTGGGYIRNETFVNSRIGDGRIGGVDTEGLGGYGIPDFENCKFYINDDWGNASFITESNGIHHKNIKYYFNDKASNHYAITDNDLRLVYFADTSKNYMRADEPTSNNGAHDGSYIGTFVYNALVVPNMLHRVGWEQYACNNKDFYHSIPLKIVNGYEKSFKIKDGEINGWFWLGLNEFPTDGIGTFKTVTIEDVDVIVPPNIDATEGFLNNSKYGSGITLQNLLRVTQDVNVNLIFKNCSFISEDTTTGLFMYLGNRGTTDFIDCTFDAPQAENINFTSTGAEITSGVYAGVNTGAITIKDAITPSNRITFTGATVL